MMLEDKNLTIMTYNTETLIAEKFQTIISRNILNSRMKDYYDLYYLIKNEAFSKNTLTQAIKNTFNKRDTKLESTSINKILSDIENSDFIKDLWNAYSKKYPYANNIDFKTIINYIKTINSYL